MLGFQEILFHHHWWRVNQLLVQGLPKTQKFHQRHVSGLLGLNQSQSCHSVLIVYRAVSLRRVCSSNPCKTTFKGETLFKTPRRFVKILSVSVPHTGGLHKVHLMSFFELGFFLVVVSRIGCLAVEFADGTTHL